MSLSAIRRYSLDPEFFLAIEKGGKGRGGGEKGGLQSGGRGFFSGELGWGKFSSWRVGGRGASTGK